MCMIGKDRKQPPHSIAEVICTLRETKQEIEAYSDISPSDGGNDPITLTYQDMHVTLRPWDPYCCVIAAAIRNHLIHFPIKPGSGVMMLGCSLQTLSHISDIVGPTGRLIGVIDVNQTKKPTSEELRKFFKYHPGVQVITEDVQQASFDRYERLLTLPTTSKIAFLMGLHPRLGAESPIAKLSEAENTSDLIKRIFSFVDAGDAPAIKCLVVCHWPPSTRVDAIRSLVLSHIDILQRWRASKKTEDSAAGNAQATTSVMEDESGEETKDTDIAEKTTSEPEGGGGTGSRKASKTKETKSEQDSVPLWVFVDLPTDHVIINNPNPSMSQKLLEVVDDLKRLASGLRTGLLAKEQLLLTPYFPNHALLLLKYVAHRDAYGSAPSKKKHAQTSGDAATSSKDTSFAAPTGGPAATATAAAAAAAAAAAQTAAQPAPALASAAAVEVDSGPSVAAMPMPMFGSKFGALPPGMGMAKASSSSSPKPHHSQPPSAAAASSSATPSASASPAASASASLAMAVAAGGPAAAAVAGGNLAAGGSSSSAAGAASRGAVGEQQPDHPHMVGSLGGKGGPAAASSKAGRKGGAPPPVRLDNMGPGGPGAGASGAPGDLDPVSILPARHGLGSLGGLDGFGGFDLGGGPCSVDIGRWAPQVVDIDVGARWDQQQGGGGAGGHLPPPGLWSDGFAAEQTGPIQIGLPSASASRWQPGAGGYPGGSASGSEPNFPKIAGKGSGAGGAAGKGPTNLAGRHNARPGSGKAQGLSKGAAPNGKMDSLQYMPMSF